ncbi:MAG: right-handed parallel beta-helix repeat-containing protein [Acidobacteria bacterium]|nr:right-handed parallel beta-helix repeat-containing protein [Acidobacteriota bacterium]
MKHLKSRLQMKKTCLVLFGTASIFFTLSWPHKQMGQSASRPTSAIAVATPELPRVTLNSDFTPSSGKAIAVNAGADFQAALNRALPGDTITLKAGVTFTGNFFLPAKKGAGWIVIRTSTPDADLPSPGVRITPQQAGLLPKIMTPNSDAALSTAPGAHHYRLVGLEIGVLPTVKTNYGVVKLGDGSNAQRSLALVPTDLIVDRCYIHGNEKGDVSRGIALNSARTAIIDSYLSECHAVGMDTQAICGWNGPGPFKIVNNYLEGAGENFMLGGADPSIPGLVPSDIEFRRNHVSKPLRWKVGDPAYGGIHWSVKNLLELKNSQRILIEANVFENTWGDAQDGFAMVIKSVNQDGGAPWSVTQDVTIVNNLIQHCGSGINLLGRDMNQLGIQMQRVLVRNNLWDDIDGTRWRAQGKFLQISDVPDVVVDHNTVLQTGNIITTYGSPCRNLVFTNNITNHNQYGVKGDDAGSGNGTIARYFPGAMFIRNIIVGGSNGSYPTGNWFPRTFAEVGALERDGNLRLTLLKPYLAKGTDEKDIGCDLANLAKSIAGVTAALPVEARR